MTAPPSLMLGLILLLLVLTVAAMNAWHGFRTNRTKAKGMISSGEKKIAEGKKSISEGKKTNKKNWMTCLGAISLTLLLFVCFAIIVIVLFDPVELWGGIQ